MLRCKTKLWHRLNYLHTVKARMRPRAPTSIHSLSIVFSAHHSSDSNILSNSKLYKLQLAFEPRICWRNLIWESKQIPWKPHQWQWCDLICDIVILKVSQLAQNGQNSISNLKYIISEKKIPLLLSWKCDSLEGRVLVRQLRNANTSLGTLISIWNSNKCFSNL